MSRQSRQNSMQNKEKNETGSFQPTLLYLLQFLRGKITGGVLMGPAPIKTKTQTTPEEHWPKKSATCVCRIAPFRTRSSLGKQRQTENFQLWRSAKLNACLAHILPLRRLLLGACWIIAWPHARPPFVLYGKQSIIPNAPDLLCTGRYSLMFCGIFISRLPLLWSRTFLYYIFISQGAARPKVQIYRSSGLEPILIL